MLFRTLTSTIRLGLATGLLLLIPSRSVVSAGEPQLQHVNIQDGELEYVLKMMTKITGNFYFYSSSGIRDRKINISPIFAVTGEHLQTLLEAAMEERHCMLVEVQASIFYVIPFDTEPEHIPRTGIPIRNATEVRYPHRIHTLVLPVRHARAGDLAIALRDTLTPGVGDATAVPGENSLLIRDFGHCMAAIEQVARALDIPVAAVTIRAQLKRIRDAGETPVADEQLDAICRHPGDASPLLAEGALAWNANVTFPAPGGPEGAGCTIRLSPIHEDGERWRLEYRIEWTAANTAAVTKKHGEIRVESGKARSITLRHGEAEYRCYFTLTPTE